MEMNEFESMNGIDQEGIIFAHGVFLANLESGNYICDVFSLFDFFVLFCFEIKNNKKAIIATANYPDKLPDVFKTFKIFG